MVHKGPRDPALHSPLILSPSTLTFAHSTPCTQTSSLQTLQAGSQLGGFCYMFPLDPAFSSHESLPKCHPPVKVYPLLTAPLEPLLSPTRSQDSQSSLHCSPFFFNPSHLLSFSMHKSYVLCYCLSLQHLAYKLYGSGFSTTWFIDISQVPRNMPGINNILNKYLSN